MALDRRTPSAARINRARLPRDPTVTIGRMEASRRHERRVASYGSLVFPTHPVDVWEARRALVTVVSETGPVTVFKSGEVVGRSIEP